jgi:hypothetical protein
MSNLFAQIAAQQQAAAAAAANPVSYVPASRRDVIRAYPVLRLLAVCHPPTTTTGGTGITNHWTLTFEVSDSKSVRLDIQPNPNPSQIHTNGGQKAYVIVSELEYLVTTHAVRFDIVSVTYQRTVGWYIDYFAAGGRFRYAFHPQGVGCRQWQTDTMQLLSDTGNVNRAESEVARRALACTWPDGRPAAPAAGTYF